MYLSRVIPCTQGSGMKRRERKKGPFWLKTRCKQWCLSECWCGWVITRPRCFLKVMALPNLHSPPKLGQSIGTLNWLKWIFYHLLKLIFWVGHCGWFPRICSFSLTEYHQRSLRNWPWLQWCISLVQEYFNYPLVLINSRIDKWPKADQLCRSNCMGVSRKVHSNQWLSLTFFSHKMSL